MDKIKLVIFTFLCNLFFLNSYATVYAQPSLDSLIKDTDSLAEVVLIRKEPFKSNLGMIHTKYIFEVIESYNLEDKLNSTNLIEVEMIGGSLNGYTTIIDGAPTFEHGEKALILLKFINEKTYISNLSLGKFHIIQDSGKTFYKSSIVPSHHEIGMIEKTKMLESFNMKVRDQIKVKLDETKNTAVVERVTSKVNPVHDRNPAQEQVTRSPWLLSSLIGAWLILMLLIFLKPNEEN